MKSSIELTDEFNQPTGEWIGYSSIDREQNEALRNQKHVDIRSFVPDLPAARVNMLFMDRFAMYTLDGEGGKGTELAQYSSDSTPPAHMVVVNNESWTFGEVGPQEDRNNWDGITVTCKAGQVTTTQSIITFNG